MNNQQIIQKNNPQTAIFLKRQKLCTLLPSYERQVIERKYSSLPIGALSIEEIPSTALQIFSKIIVITGWNMPEDQEFRMLLIDQFMKKMVESYSTLNLDEIEYAFRNNDEIKDWGRKINLSLIDDVLRRYMADRFEASRVEEEITLKLEAPELPVEKVEDSELIEISRSTYNLTRNWKLISPKCFSILNIQIDEKEKNKIRILAKAAVDAMYLEDRNAFKEIPRERLENRMCKKIAVARCFDGLLPLKKA